jgi:hypothetical protein
MPKRVRCEGRSDGTLAACEANKTPRPIQVSDRLAVWSKEPVAPVADISLSATIMAALVPPALRLNPAACVQVAPYQFAANAQYKVSAASAVRLGVVTVADSDPASCMLLSSIGSVVYAPL